MENRISILFPPGFDEDKLKSLSQVAWHDIGMDLILAEMSSSEEERSILKAVMMKLSEDDSLAKFRSDVFEDIYKNPDIRIDMMNLLKQVKNLQDYMSTGRNIDKRDTVWTLTRRLKEVNDYILCIEAMETCLSKAELHSEGLTALRDYVHQIQSDCYFSDLKKDISGLKDNNMKVKSVTLGVNLNENYDALSVGVVSLNDKPFTKAPLLGNFARKLSTNDSIQEGTEWDGKMSFHEMPSETDHSALERTALAFTVGFNPIKKIFLGMSTIHKQTAEEYVMEHLDAVVNNLLANSVKELKTVLSRYASVNIYSITGLIPEFIYYILWADYIEKLSKDGYSFSKANAVSDQNSYMQASELYNLKLAAISHTPAAEIVKNDLRFDDAHCVYILTGANRGGKTTITQAIGQLFVLAQGGIYVPASAFSYAPLDGILTHFPADEDKTLDFGRLGEECARFKSMYQEATKHSLMLLNETFSTTSFEEGYYIAFDAVKAILNKHVRTIYNTHMHKLGREIDKLNDSSQRAKAASIIVKTIDGKRSYQIEEAPAENSSYAFDIAKKYGVTYEQLTCDQQI